MTGLLAVCVGAALWTVAFARPVATWRVDGATDARPTLYVEPMNGLSNRLRVVASARALARASDYRLVLVWIPDVQCNVSLDRLIETTERVVDAPPPDVATVRRVRDPRDVVTLSTNATDTYVRSPFVLRSDVRYEHLIAREFRQMRPASAVLDLVATLEQEVGGDHEIATHVRMLSDYARDIPGVDTSLEREFTTHVSVHREACHWRYFVAPLTYVGASRRTCTLDADVSEATARLRDALGNGHVLGDSCDGADRRSGRCVQIAFAHVLFMARAHILLLSHWSSYSELIRWFAPRHSLAVDGCDHRPERRAWVRTSVVVACRDRATAQRVVHAALRVSDNATEVVVVDWSSRHHVRVGDDPRVRLVRVEDVDAWNLAQAYNVGFRHASGTWILKIDCDTELGCMPTPPAPRTIATGNWMRSGHLNGVAYLPREVLDAVGGYDERLARYGWDDSDLYQRIGFYGYARRDLEDGCVRHLAHADALRGVASALDGLVLTQKNRLCIGEQLWNASARASEYRAMFWEPSRLLQVWRPEPIETTSTTCDDRLAVAIVLFHLFSECTAPNCKDHFWRVTREDWVDARELMIRLVPTHIDLAVQCARLWPAFVSPTTVPACARCIASFDAYVRALSTPSPEASSTTEASSTPAVRQRARDGAQG